MIDNTVHMCIESMRFPDSPTELIKGLHLDVPSNSFVSLIGRSGAGKTTLLRMVAGLERRFIGDISLGGLSITRAGRQVQLVFQDYRLLPWATVQENVAFALSARERRANMERVDRWLRLVGLEERRNALPKTLSGGESGRVAFARAFVDQPRVLLLDEPFRGVDLMTRLELQQELVNALAVEPATVILVSHSIEDAVFVSDRVCVLADSPMRVESEFVVEAPHPRKYGDQALSSVVAEISAYLAACRGAGGSNR